MQYYKSFILLCFIAVHSLVARIPYTYSIKKNKQLLTYVGTTHSHDPKHHQYDSIKKEWSQFLAKTKRDCVILIEGESTPPEPNLCEQEIIREKGDRGFAHYLGLKHNVPVINADLDKEKQTRMLLKTYSQTWVHYWIFAFLTEMWNRFPDKPSFKTYVSYYLDKWSGDSSLTIDDMKKLHTKLFKTSFNKTDAAFFSSLTTSHEYNGITNDISRSAIELRCQHTIQVIKKYWKEGKSIFIVYGATHAKKQKKTLYRELT
jgi:hypothetical protein